MDLPYKLLKKGIEDELLPAEHQKFGTIRNPREEEKRPFIEVYMSSIAIRDNECEPLSMCQSRRLSLIATTLSFVAVD